MAAGQQRIDDMTADKTGASGNEHAHLESLSSLEQPAQPLRHIAPPDDLIPSWSGIARASRPACETFGESLPQPAGAILGERTVIRSFAATTEANRMIRCPHCDHFNPDDVAVCERCETILVQTERETAEPDSSLEAQVLAIVATGGKLAAIKWIRQQTGLGLKESKDAVELLMQQHNVSSPRSGCAGMVLLFALSSSALAALIDWR